VSPPQGIDSKPKRSGHIKTDLIDVDLVRGEYPFVTRSYILHNVAYWMDMVHATLLIGSLLFQDPHSARQSQIVHGQH
jgi:hypothetical protein